MQTSVDQRVAPRFDVRQSVVVDSSWAEATNISARGVYFETHFPMEVGSEVRVVVRFTSNGARHEVASTGRVVRVEQQGWRTGVAAELATPLFEEETVRIQI
ncbi:PilZ domain-containing protein [Ramlibacter sp.]|uniref:PilZ domain-containing protein n=1 Tax=Ramlibacter sp. TaxID=1917967 RepID=UPI003D102332